MIAEKLKKNLGAERFAVLNEAITRAPGGVARGFTRPTFGTEAHATTTTTQQPVQQPTQQPVQQQTAQQEEQLSVKELQQVSFFFPLFLFQF